MCVAVSPMSHAALAGAHLYIEIARPVRRLDNGRNVDVVIGNGGTSVHRENFDATLEVAVNGKPLCSATTNFVTPIGAGQTIHALRLDVGPAASPPDASYTLRASLRFWDTSIGATQTQTTVALPPGRAKCIALKPRQ